MFRIGKKVKALAAGLMFALLFTASVITTPSAADRVKTGVIASDGPQQSEMLAGLSTYVGGTSNPCGVAITVLSITVLLASAALLAVATGGVGLVAGAVVGASLLPTATVLC